MDVLSEKYLYVSDVLAAMHIAPDECVLVRHNTGNNPHFTEAYKLGFLKEYTALQREDRLIKEISKPSLNRVFLLVFMNPYVEGTTTKYMACYEVENVYDGRPAVFPSDFPYGPEPEGEMYLKLREIPLPVSIGGFYIKWPNNDFLHWYKPAYEYDPEIIEIW